MRELAGFYETMVHWRRSPYLTLEIRPTGEFTIRLLYFGLEGDVLHSIGRVRIDEPGRGTILHEVDVETPAPPAPPRRFSFTKDTVDWPHIGLAMGMTDKHWRWYPDAELTLQRKPSAEWILANPGQPHAQAPRLPLSGQVVGAPRLSEIELEVFEWPAEVDDATRALAEQHLETMLEVGGDDGRRSEAWFVAQGRPLAGRLISEFPEIVEAHFFHRDARVLREGMLRLAVLDRTLSRLDGTVASKWKSRTLITQVTDRMLALARLKRWTWWWKSGLWKSDPVDPE